MSTLKERLAALQPLVNERLARRVADFDPLVRPVVEHVLKAGGKRLRPILVLLCREAFGEIPFAPAVERFGDPLDAACSLELLHSATLLHDDVLDRAELRRGAPAAHKVFGTTETILAGDALLALGNRLMAATGVPALVETISVGILKTAVGEIKELSKVGDAFLSRDDYIDVIAGKTAYLIEAACRVGAESAQASPERVEAASAYGLNLGIAFQLVDDALDYLVTEKEFGKPVGADMAEGKTTLPLIVWFESQTPAEREAFARDFKAGSLDPDRIALVAASVRAAKGPEITLDLAKAYVAKAGESLANLPESRARTALAEALDYVVNRRK